MPGQTERLECCTDDSCCASTTHLTSTPCCSAKVDECEDDCCKHESEMRSNDAACCSIEDTKLDTCCATEKSESVSKSVKDLIQEACTSGCCLTQSTDESTCCESETRSCSDSCCSDGQAKVGGFDASFEITQAAGGEHYEYNVFGMDCASCAATIEKSVGRLSGIQSATVNFSTGKLQVVGANAAVIEQLPGHVKKIGYTLEPVETRRKRTYVVEGMDCGACAKTIENHLRKVPGVRTVTVNFSTGKMVIDHDNTIEEIVSEVTKAGYRASLDTKEQAANSESRSNHSQEWLIATSGVLFVFGLIFKFVHLPSYIATFLFALVIVSAGYKPSRSAVYGIRSRSLDMNVLMSLAALGAAIIGQWAEGASVVWLFSFGTMLQNKSIDKTRSSIRSLMNLAPPEAWVKIGSEYVRRPVSSVGIGDIVLVKPGERISLDGEVVKGESTINQAPITGESIPVDKAVGAQVYAGTINENGSLEIVVSKLAEDSAISRIIRMVEEAQEKKAPTQALVDKFARVYTPVVFVLAFLVMVVPPLMGFGAWLGWIYKGLELLVVACPCALVISTPVAIVSAIGNAARNGVLIKGGTSLETTGKITAVAFDKTGTLTEGKPNVVEVTPLQTSKDHLLAIATTLEGHSTHPIASAIVRHAEKLGIKPLPGDGFRNILGKGVTATVEGTEYFAGNLNLFQSLDASIEHIIERVRALQSEGNTIVIVGTKDHIHGFITVADTVRSTTSHTIQALKNTGIGQIVMLTGDNEGTAKRVASETGVTGYYAELLPDGKVKALKTVQQNGNVVAMVGDGINDAPALATADVGIAMGGAGTDTAMETADVVLMSDNLEKLPYTIQISRRALGIIKQNVWFSLVIKFLALVLIFPGLLTLWGAVMSDTGAAIIVILNSMRLLSITKQP